MPDEINDAVSIDRRSGSESHLRCMPSESMLHLECEELMELSVSTITPSRCPRNEIPPDVAEIMIISRGHGLGHAMPDMAIATALLSLASNLTLRFVSYASGAEAYRVHGHQVLDLHRPDNPPFMDMIVIYTRLLSQTRPLLVVAHEEMPVLPAAKAFKIPCLFITDYFEDPSHLSTWVLRYAEEIIFTAQQGLYTEPPYLRGKVRYVGRAVREFEYTAIDRCRARAELAIPQDATVALCQPGAWAESQMPFADLLATAWNSLEPLPRLLIWLAGGDYESLTARFKERADIRILKEDWKIDRLMVASDVLITKANRMTVYEAAAIGLPSISISSFVNWPDDVAVARVSSNTPVLRDTMTPDALAKLIVERKNSRPLPARELSGGVAGAAARIAYHIERLRASSDMG
jgi:UDP-N-acetylglucosamine:LPS N-acetylglucosamine transferase